MSGFASPGSQQLGMGIYQGRAVSEPDSLLTGLSVWFSLDETSGSRADSHTSGLSLTDNNSVLSVSGKQSNAADFVKSNSEYLSHTNNSAFSPAADEDLTIAFWSNVDSATSSNVAVTKWNSVVTIEYYLYGSIASDSKVWFTYALAGSSSSISAASGTTVSSGTWHFVVAQMDRTAGEISVSVDLGTAGTASSGSAFTANTGADFMLSKNPYADGSLDEVAIWKRLLTSDEKTRLYNSGNGISYPG